MRAPPITYRYSYPRDTAGQTFQPLYRHISVTAQTAVVTTTFAGIPRDKVLVLSNACVDADPGAAQSCLQIVLRGHAPAGIAFNIRIENFVADADETRSLNWQGEIFLVGNATDQINVRAFATFSSGVAANTTTFSLYGVVVPLANVGPF